MLQFNNRIFNLIFKYFFSCFTCHITFTKNDFPTLYISARHRLLCHLSARPHCQLLQRTSLRINGVKVHANRELQVRSEGLFVLQRVLQLSELFVQRMLQLCW